MTDEEFNDTLMLLLNGLGATKPQAMLIMATIKAYHLQNEMADWVAGHYGKGDTLTIQSVMSHMNRLVEKMEKE